MKYYQLLGKTMVYQRGKKGWGGGRYTVSWVSEPERQRGGERERKEEWDKENIEPRGPRVDNKSICTVYHSSLNTDCTQIDTIASQPASHWDRIINYGLLCILAGLAGRGSDSHSMICSLHTVIAMLITYRQISLRSKMECIGQTWVHTANTSANSKMSAFNQYCD